jgi:hypothetical protein
MTGFYRRFIPLLSFLFFFSIAAAQPLPKLQSVSNSEIAFAVYSQNTLYGMNLDNSQGEIRFRIVSDHNHKVLFIDKNIGDVYGTAAGFNDSGIFVAYQYLSNTLQSALLTPANFQSSFAPVLFENNSLPSKKDVLTRADFPSVNNANLLAADDNRNRFVIETSNGISSFQADQDKFVVLTNQLSTAVISPDENNFYHPLQQKARLENEINKNLADFSINYAFNALKIAQPEQDSLASIVIDPGKNEIYLAFDKDYEKIWMINLDGGTIETYGGFEKYHKGNIPDIGITANDLRILNFSNEGLMVKIIFGAIGILIIIIMTIIFNIRNF